MNLLFGLLTFIFVACSTQKSVIQADSTQTTTWNIAPAKVVCQGEADQWCLKVQKAPAANWEYFHDNIEGFFYQWGYAYTIVVRKKEVENPAEDSSTQSFTLVKVKERTKVDKLSITLPVGTWQLNENRMDALGDSFSFAPNTNLPTTANEPLLLELQWSAAGQLLITKFQVILH
jgi:hypothetical protein